MPMNMEFKRKLPAPRTVKDMYPVTEEMAQNKRENDRQIQAVITGGDPRLMLLIAPAPLTGRTPCWNMPPACGGRPDRFCPRSPQNA